MMGFTAQTGRIFLTFCSFIGELINSEQTVDKFAEGAGTIGYEFLTSLGQRYNRKYASVTK